jgi:small subunit ribosomal protein S30e
LPSHGSLTKAGKVRSLTPKTKSKNNSSPNPRVGNRKAYIDELPWAEIMVNIDPVEDAMVIVGDPIQMHKRHFVISRDIKQEW